MKRFSVKIMALCLCASFLAGGLSACGTGDGENAGTENTNTTESEIIAGSKTLELGEITKFDLPTGVEESDVYVEPVENISDDFIRGMDASSVLVEEKSGVKYYNEQGEEQDVFMTFAQAGVNYIRLRVWNDPYDENGNGYGGGNNDVATAIELGKRATKYGMQVCIDYHYSDFWSDPKRQHAPKAWANMNIDEKYDALYKFTRDSLIEMLDAGVNIGMVQVGNEVNYGMAGVKGASNVNKLMAAGCKAVRDVSKMYNHDIKIVIHYTRITEPANIYSLVKTLVEQKMDFDIIGMSYYPFWDGSMENMKDVLTQIQKRYNKQVLLAETSYCYTSEDGDGNANSLIGSVDAVPGYPATVQGQTSMIRDVIAAANEAGALGIFYWEGAWIPVGPATQDNSPIWEKYGSGWASSFAGDYDPEDAGLYYGGSSWDNQAFFDFNGYPLASLDVFRCLKYGTVVGGNEGGQTESQTTEASSSVQ